MAHGVRTTQKPKLHQALHGYADGHRQLALSTALKPRDQKTLLALSDISGPGARLDEQGYLTGYPLADSGFYALARTWPAPEMPRPGCVWTHTLLIDFTDLARLETLSGLLDMFHRPSGSGSAHAYSKPATFDAGLHVDSNVIVESWARNVMAGLYGNPRSRVVVKRPGPRVDDMVLALWSQQWPRLRRSFRFCTFAASDRSSDSVGFDLQVLPNMDRNVRARFSDVVDADIAAPRAGEWLDDAVEDLLRPDSLGLRTFLRRLGADLALGREAFRPLCRLHSALTTLPSRPKSVHDAIRILQNEFVAKQARTARSLIAKAALEQVGSLGAEAFDFLWSNLGLLDNTIIASAAVELGRSAWRREPDLLVQLLNEADGLRLIVERTFDELDVVELVEGLTRAPLLIATALLRRPELVGEPAFWAKLNAEDDGFQVAKYRNMQFAAFAAILQAERSDLISRVVQEFGSALVLGALCVSQSSQTSDLLAWVRAAAVDTGGVAEFLAAEQTIPRPILYALARAIPPDAVPNDYGLDPWLLAYRNAVGVIPAAASDYLAAYLLSRALGMRTKSPGELAQVGFEVTYAAAASNHLPDDAWWLVEPRLPWSVFWFEWDRCQRLRAGVVDLFVERELSPHLFARLVHDAAVFYMLSERAARTSRGRSYLKRVRRVMRAEGNDTFREHLRALEKALE